LFPVYFVGSIISLSKPIKQIQSTKKTNEVYSKIELSNSALKDEAQSLHKAGFISKEQYDHFSKEDT
jgi:predicted transcriptional regulator